MGDKFRRSQLIQALLEPSASIHPDYGTVAARTLDGKRHAGVLRERTENELQLFDAEGTMVQLPIDSIDEVQRSLTSLMPVGVSKTLKSKDFADLVASLESLKQPGTVERIPGMPNEILSVEKPIRLAPLHDDTLKFDNPVWIIAIPNRPGESIVVEQKTRKLWRHADDEGAVSKELFADFSDETTTGEFDGVVCVAVHPRFTENGKYFVKYHARDQGSYVSPVVVERQATAELSRDAGVR